MRKQGFQEEVRWHSSGKLVFPFGLQERKEARPNTGLLGHGFLRGFQSPTIFLKVSCDGDFVLPIIVGILESCRFIYFFLSLFITNLDKFTSCQVLLFSDTGEFAIEKLIDGIQGDDNAVIFPPSLVFMVGLLTLLFNSPCVCMIFLQVCADQFQLVGNVAEELGYDVWNYMCWALRLLVVVH